MKSILITGGAGFIGSHTSLVLLERGFNVFVIDSLINSYAESIYKVRKIFKKNHHNAKNDIYFFSCDLCDIENAEIIFKNIYSKGFFLDGIIHFAGFKSVTESIQRPNYYWSNNINTSLNVLKLMKKYKCKNMVFSSSAAIYGQVINQPILENCKKNPKNPYASTKLFIEEMFEREAILNEYDFKILSLRYFNPVGAHPTGEIGENSKSPLSNIFPILIKAANNKKFLFEIFGNDWPTEDSTCIRDYIHVMDLAEAHLNALIFLKDSSYKYLGLNIGTGKGTSVLEILNIFQKVNKVKINFKFSPRRSGDSGIVYADTSLAKKLLNWKASRSLEDMCRDGWSWYLKFPNGYNF